MKTNLVKKGSEKNIEMFKMSNEELVMVAGGGEGLIVEGPDGKPIIIIRGGFSNFRYFGYRND